jgi:hypothetical protein
VPDSTVSPSTEARVDSSVEMASQQLLLEISKTLLTGTLAATRGTMQTLQSLTGILLAAYSTLLVGFGKQVGIDRIPKVAAAAPVVLYVFSLLAGFVQTILYRGAPITLGDLRSGMQAYETVVAAQRRQLILPALLLLGAIVANGVVAAYVLRLH